MGNGKQNRANFAGEHNPRASELALLRGCRSKNYQLELCYATCAMRWRSRYTLHMLFIRVRT